MSSSMVITSVPTAREPIAPWWHTLLVLMPLAAMSVASKYQHGLANAHIPGLSSRLSGYFTVLAAEWFQALLIWLALRHRGLSIRSLVSERWQTLGSFFRDFGLAVGFLVVALPLVGLLMHLVRGNAVTNMSNFTPKSVSELVVFLVLATTGGGFCEELIFRGYLTQQFSAWTGGSRIFAVFLQGVFFGLGHGYYGKAMVVVMVHGWLLGSLAYWRKSLRPGMLAHGLQDSIGGIVAFLS
jgi:membrane protease YdiL (CAAX protease family)